MSWLKTSAPKIKKAAMLVVVVIIAACCIINKCVDLYKASKCTEPTTATIVSVAHTGSFATKIRYYYAFQYLCAYEIDGVTYNRFECSNTHTTINTLMKSGLSENPYKAVDLIDYQHITKDVPLNRDFQKAWTFENKMLQGAEVHILYNPENPEDFIFDESYEEKVESPKYAMWIIVGAVVVTLLVLFCKDFVVFV
jgi:hypothetical protein